MTSPASRCDDIVALIDECLDEVAQPPTAVPAPGSDAFEVGAVEEWLHTMRKRVGGKFSISRH